MANFGILSELNESKCFEWKITNFSSLPTATLSKSPFFTFANNTLCFCIRLPTTSERNVLVVLCNEMFSAPSPDITYSSSFQKSDGTFISLVADGIYKILHKSVFEKNTLELLFDDSLTIICDLKLIKNKEQGIIAAEKENSLKKNAVIETSKHMKLTEIELLSKNFKELFISKECCDVVLLVQGKEFKAHISVLIARSSVFAAMFRHDTTEKQTWTVIILDCDPDSFLEFLEYLYCGTLDNMSSNNALHLYRTSDKYNVQELKTFCTSYLMENLTVQNVCDVVVLADEYDEASLLSSVQEFFNNNLQEIFVTTEWENLFKKNFRLANKLLVEMSKVKK